ncbi:transcriptional regulator, SarA/Rot family [Staphylococcus caeli]|uniref:Staphylococcal accessory regulator family n=1 Tax=Staphylococcus caeli TaxID=2201815 RepID=A0A1D4Q0W3_9STAP|nr:hypothetical protein [Staphylococcus caeli]SCT28851.1 staphylococcal accessory regulator family [Staphylococcus caeli]SCT33289.1 staphylococcal accessory regulator family [Staphylococcus caeli]
MKLEEALIVSNEVRKAIKRKSKLSAFDYYVWSELISIYIEQDSVIYIKSFVEGISQKTKIDKMKVVTSLKKLDYIGFIHKHKSDIDERKVYLSVDKKQYELFKDLSQSVTEQLKKLH